LYFCDHGTYGAVIPLGPVPATEESPVSLSVRNDHLIYSISSYKGGARDFSREEICRWRTGFALQLARARDFSSFASFVAYADLLNAEESADSSGIRSVTFSGPGAVLAAVYDPSAERFHSRTWNGTEQRVSHLRVEGGTPARTLITPLTLFGSEAMPERT